MINRFTPHCTCTDALSFLLDLNSLEVNLYFILVQDQKKTVAELCELTARTQSTVYQALEKLVVLQVVSKIKRSGKKRGYEYVYQALEPQQVKNLLKHKLASLYNEISSCLDTFDRDALTCEITLETFAP